MTSSEERRNVQITNSAAVFIEGNEIGHWNQHSTQNINILSADSSASSVQLPPLLYGFPEYSNECPCLGRQDDAEQLLKLLRKHKRVLITGISGIGKTTIGIHCADKWTCEGHFKYAVKINMETTQTAIQSFKGLAKKLSCQMQYENIITKDFYDHLSEKIQSEKILIFLDNIEHTVIVNNYIPGRDRDNYYILGTSQFAELDEIFEIYPLKKLSEDSAIELFMDVFKYNINIHTQMLKQTVDVQALLKQLDYLPIAVRHAAALLKDELKYGDKNYSVKCYIKNYIERLNEPFPVESATGMNNSVVRAIQINIEKAAQNKHAEKLLNVMSFLNPSHISVMLLLRMGNFTAKYFSEAERHLRKFSIISEIGKKGQDNYIEEVDISRHNQLQIHRLVFHVVRSIMNVDKRGEILSIAFGIAVDKMYSHGEFVLPYMDEKMITTGYQLAFSSGNYLQKRVVQSLDRAGYSISALEEWGAAHYATYMQHSNVIQKLCTEQTSNFLIRETATTGWSVLHVAALRPGGIQFLLEYVPADVFESTVNTQTQIKQTAAIHLAAVFVDNADMKELIALGCDVNLIDKDRNTALHFAAMNDDQEVIETLALHGADINITNESGNAPVYVAAWKGCEKATKTLVDLGCELSSIRYNQNSLYTCARPYMVKVKNATHGGVHTYVASSVQLFVVLKFKSHRILQSESILLHKLVENADGIHVLKICIGRSVWTLGEEEELLDLVRLLCNVVVVLPMAAYFIHNEGLSVGQLIIHINDAADCADVTAICPAEDSCAGVCRLIWLVIDTVKSKYPLALNILLHLPYIDPATLDNHEKLSECLNISEEELASGLEVLLKYGLIDKVGELETCEMHSVVSAVTREYVQVSGQHMEICTTLLSVALGEDSYYRSDGYHVVQFMSVSEITAAYVKRYNISSRWHEVLELLRGLGCEVTEASAWTVWHYTAADGRMYAWDLINSVTSLKTDVNIAVCGVTALHIASLSGNFWMVCKLLAAGADAHIKTNEQLTTLHMAAASNSLCTERIIVELLETGVDIHAIDTAGRTALQIVKQNGQTSDVIRLLSFQKVVSVR